MAKNPIVTALSAKADQAIAKYRERIQVMVNTYRETLADGHDPTNAIGFQILANLTTLNQLERGQLLAGRRGDARRGRPARGRC